MTHPLKIAELARSLGYLLLWVGHIITSVFALCVRFLSHCCHKQKVVDEYLETESLRLHVLDHCCCTKCM